jgi:hypothetical protein
VRIGIGPGEVAQRVFRGRPLLGGHTRIVAAWNSVCRALEGPSGALLFVPRCPPIHKLPRRGLLGNCVLEG